MGEFLVLPGHAPERAGPSDDAVAKRHRTVGDESEHTLHIAIVRCEGSDPGEKRNLAAEQPEVVERLLKFKEGELAGLKK